jgi:hypothetical protein
MCVFGHYHVSYGVERVVWRDGAVGEDDDGVAESEILTDEKDDGFYDFTSLKPGKESVFVNAAWMTGDKRMTEKRNKPVVIDLMAQLSSA